MKSNLGVHYIGRGPEPALIAAGMRVVKCVNSDPPTDLPTDTLIVFRWVENPDNVNGQMGNGNPEGSAQAWVDKQWMHIQFVTKRAFIEGPNENASETVAQAEWFGRFEIERMKIMAARGYKCAVGCWGTGRPPRPNTTDANGTAIWNALTPMMRYAKVNGHIAEMHAYEYNPHDIFHMLRYRTIYGFLPADARPPLLIGEWGLDGAKGRFRDSQWRDQFSDPDQAYMDIMATYDAETQKDAYVVGFTVYTDGTGDDSQWGPFDIAGQKAIDLMANYLRSQPSGEPHMADFQVGQRVYVVSISGIKLRSALGDQQTPPNDTASYGDSGVVLAGPLSLPTRLEMFYKLDFNGKVGWAAVRTTTGDVLLSVNPPAPPVTGIPNTGRRMKTKVPDHGTPRYVYRGPNTASGARDDFQGGSGIGNRIDWTYSYFTVDGFEYSAADSDWFLHLKSGRGYFSGDAWVKFHTTRLNEPMDVYDGGKGPDNETLDGLGMPDWTKPAVVTTTPPSVPPPTPPPPVTWPEPPAIPVGVDLLGGRTFEDGWTTDGKGNQIPKEHGLVYTDHSGQAMPYPTKHADSADGRTTVVIPATAMGWGEYIHKANSGNNSVPSNEKNGAVREIILDGEFAYKEMGNIAQAATLRRTVKGTPGQTATLVLHVSAESQDTPQSRTHPGRLEDDHMLVGLKWGALPEEVRNYAYMQTRRDVRLADGTIVDRPWNRFMQTTVFPANGELEYVLTCQNNWPRTFPQGGNDFFIDKIMVIVSDAPPPPPPPGLPPVGTAYTEGQQNAVLDALRAKVGV